MLMNVLPSSSAPIRRSRSAIRLMACLARHEPAAAIVEALHRQIESFCRYQPYHDDVTVVIVKVPESA